jgi:hypothetical protein
MDQSSILDSLGETSQIGDLLQGFWSRCVVVKGSCKQNTKNLALRKSRQAFHNQNDRRDISGTLY